MSSITPTIASNVVLSALLAAFAVAMTRLWRNPHLAHGLWLLVLLKLVTPPLVHMTVPESWFAAEQRQRRDDEADRRQGRPQAHTDVFIQSLRHESILPSRARRHIRLIP